MNDIRIRHVALIVLYDGECKILLQDRRRISKGGEEWGFFGGGIENEESAEEAVVRESFEELSIVLKNHKYIGNDVLELRDFDGGDWKIQRN